uniref:Secreted protein n=1 Tax=Elaeophora elaphi TaxID=1147741 RepID=A0A0R3S6I5_9BILA
MRTNVRFFIFFLGTIKVTTVAELLTQTIIKFDPFETGKILSVQHFNTSNVTSTHINFPNVNVKIREKRQRQFFTDNNFLDQRIRGNVVPQCPCVIKPGTDKCIAYDSRYQAASIEEALVAFQDLTMDDDSLRYPTSGIIVSFT